MKKTIMLAEHKYEAAQAILASRRPDMGRYFALLAEAASDGHPNALENLGAWCLEGFKGPRGWVLRRNTRKAVSLLSRAAAVGNALASFTLGNCYDEGTGVQRNPGLAKQYFAKAYRGGVTLGAMNLAALAAEEGNSRLELAWLRRAQRAGEVEATLALAERAFVRGWGARKFLKLVPELRRLARGRGPEAAEARELIKRARRCDLV